jgi:hypothetical protein
MKDGTRKETSSQDGTSSNVIGIAVNGTQIIAKEQRPVLMEYKN